MSMHRSGQTADTDHPRAVSRLLSKRHTQSDYAVWQTDSVQETDKEAQ
jgi:hypothetical protein